MQCNISFFKKEGKIHCKNSKYFSGMQLPTPSIGKLQKQPIKRASQLYVKKYDLAKGYFSNNSA